MGVKLRFSGPGAKKVTHDLERLRINGMSTKPAMAQIAQVITDANRDQFRQQGAHYGNRWAPLSPAYKLYKTRVRPGRPILMFDGRLKKHTAPVLAKNAGIYRVNNRKAEVGLHYSQVPYAKSHQEGTKRMPARPIMGTPTRQDQKRMTKAMHAWLMNGLEVLR